MIENHGAFERDKQIRFHHCDPAGIVFYPQYFVLFNEMVEDWFNDGLQVDFAQFHAVDRLGIPMGRLECIFHNPSKVGDVLRMSLSVLRVGGSSLDLRIVARCAGELRVEGKMTIVQASLESRRSVPFSADFRGRLERYLAA